MKLSIITVSWNVEKKLEENLNAIYSSKGFDLDELEVIVIDNDSKDKSVDMVRNKFPQVKVIANKKNLGYSKANNQGIGQAHGEYILLLNPDMRVHPDTLKNMIDWMDENPKASVAGCKLISETGELVRHVRNFPNVWDQAAIILKIPHFYPKVLSKYIPENFNYDKASKVDSIRGGFFMVRANRHIPFWLDERYFLWFEEVDFCLQIKKINEEVWYTPVAECIDHVGQSFKQVNSIKKQKYFRDSMLKYFKKWHPGWQYWLLRTLWPIGFLLTFIAENLKFKSKIKT